MGRSATDRTYLSIREVLGLLVDEFPDVTISKIRFLESRGLIHPERTPSGYRKFYEHDVERLRWILRQQREHFLPLKVIKGRLENGPAPSLFDTDALVGDAAPAPPPPVDPAQGAGAGAPEARVEAEPVPRPADGDGGGEAPGGAPAPEATRRRERPAPPAAADPAEARSPAGVPLAGLRFSADEVASACGTAVDLVDELEEYGLIAGKTVAGVRVYDEDDLAVARVAAGLRRFGIEARHLRVFRHAAEREASLFTQVVTPLLRQRNPAARERAERELGELTELGTELQGIFLRAVLRDLTGG